MIHGVEGAKEEKSKEGMKGGRESEGKLLK